MTALNAPSALSLATADGHVVRASGVSGNNGTYQDISPTAAERQAIGAAIKLLEDPASTKRLILLGQYGGLVCDDSTTSTPNWRAVNLSGTSPSTINTNAAGGELL